MSTTSESCACSPSIVVATPRLFTIDKPLLKNRFLVRPSGSAGAHDEQTLLVRLRPTSNKSPLLAMHDGSDAQRPLLAVTYLPLFSAHFKIGLVDDGGGGGGAGERDGKAGFDIDTMRWEDLAVANASGSKHRWSMDLRRASGYDCGPAVCRSVPRRPPGRTGFVWKRTRSVAVDGMNISALSQRNWKLVRDNGEQAVLAVFTSNPAAGRCGRMQINVDYGRDFDTMVLMTWLALYWSGR
ncbi:hypothetical protein CDD83_4631 [Cordyceps sp. RAO-2017]|nr:hypothetical protein CDD83_4631 [Cordyceps sp. RAO-2017]